MLRLLKKRLLHSNISSRYLRNNRLWLRILLQRKRHLIPPKFKKISPRKIWWIDSLDLSLKLQNLRSSHYREILMIYFTSSINLSQISS